MINKKILCSLLGVGLAVTGTMGLAGCGHEKGSSSSLFANTVYVNKESLNGGTWNESKEVFKDKNSSTNAGFYITLKPEHYNRDAYGLMNYGYSSEKGAETAPVTDDILAPTGKVFGGWYLDKECTVGNCLTNATYNKVRAELGKEAKVQIYARWLNPGDREIVYEVDGTDVKFATNSGLEVNNNQARVTVASDKYSELGKFITKEKLEITDTNQTLAKWNIDYNGLLVNYDSNELHNHPSFNNFTTEPYIYDYYEIMFSEKNFYKADVVKPFAVVHPKLIKNDESVITYVYHINGGEWNYRSYDENNPEMYNGYFKLEDTITTGISKKYFNSSIYNMINYGAHGYKFNIGANKNLDYKPYTEDVIAPEGKVFAGWFLDAAGTKAVTVNQLNELVKGHNYLEIDIYANYINNDERQIVYEDGLNQTIKTFKVSEYKDALKTEIVNMANNHTVDFNGLILDYSNGEYPTLPNSYNEEENNLVKPSNGHAPSTEALEQAAAKFQARQRAFYEEMQGKFTLDAFVSEKGNLKPFTLLVKNK